MAESIVCGPDPERYVEAIGGYVTVGFDHVSVHHVGPGQEGCFRFFARDVMPRVRKLEPPAGPSGVHHVLTAGATAPPSHRAAWCYQGQG